MAGGAVDCIVLCPLVEGEQPRLAYAAIRAGAIGVLDLEFARGTEAAGSDAVDLEAFLAAADGRGGVRLSRSQLSVFASQLSRLGRQPHWLIVAAEPGPSPVDAIAALSPSASQTLLVEVCDVETARRVAGPAVNGLIAKGHESGGPVGEDSTFVLLQKLLDLRGPTVYVRGGIGPHAAAACRMAGAAGFVLDDQLLLLSETFLPRRRWRFVARLTGQETIISGSGPVPSRVLPLPESRGVPAARSAAVQPRAANIGWSPAATAWPAGQAIGLARHFRDSYGTVGRAVRAVRDACETLPALARSQRALAPDAPLARAHATRFPIVQGPMTRVSDTPEFIDAVSEAGALPFLALALMRGDRVADLLRRTQARMDGRAWGVGLLGFVPQSLREEQISEITDAKPPFALIAGGRPDQSVALEALGVTTYLHVPSARLLRLFLEQGARRFVFEGRECGGHIGPLCSFTLWEQMVQTLLDHTAARPGSDVHVLFAGGIHDARSAAMVATIAGPLVARGVRIGVLMGTAYLFTNEAVACGAIVQAFQDEAVKCTHTASLETGPGHLTRCAVTPFVEEFQAVRARLVGEGKSADEVRDALEALNIGRLRIASKGFTRDSQGSLVSLDQHAQRSDGMYMIGQVATLHDGVQSVAALHEDVSIGAVRLLDACERPPVARRAGARPSDVAIIGLGTLLPGADTPQRYWANILARRNAITEIPRDRFDWRLYFDDDRRKRDRIYARWGGFIDEVPFDPTRFGIPPNSMRSIDPLQLLTLEVVRRALADAGYADGGSDREHTAVIFGAGGGLGDLGLLYGVRAELPRVNEVNSVHAWDRLPEWTEESFPGCLMNVAAGRVANRFNFGGSNFTVDAACASSLAAVDIAMRELETGRSNLAIAGGIDTLQNPFAYFCFAKTQALSPRGQAQAFDRKADGIVISEGLAVLVLKRLADAERDGDRVYAVIKAIGSSSDGKALGLTAPLPAGQKRALRRAYEKAGMRPSSLGLFEAHGTGTPVGDRAEAETIVDTLAADGAAARSCVLGSVKTLIGHTKAAAGAAALVKVALSLHHRVLPPHAGADQPIDPIASPQSPVCLLKEPKPWLRNGRRPRRAGVSAFGFGGTNFHAVLEEAPDGDASAPGHVAWPHELVVIRAATRADLARQIGAWQRQLSTGEPIRLRDLAWTCASSNDVASRQPFCVAVVASSVDTLREQLASALAVVEGKPDATVPRGVRVSNLDHAATSAPNAVAFLFPGQGAQHVNMLRDAALYLRPLREALEFADAHLDAYFDRPLSEFIYPPSAFTPEEESANDRRLTDTRVAQPAIGAIELGCIDLMTQLGLTPAMSAGHSYGEVAALHAAGALSKEDFLTLSARRGRALGLACDGADTSGRMAAVAIERQRLEELLREYAGLVCANHNAPRQSVVSGASVEVERLVEQFGRMGISAQLLTVAGAFHSPLMMAAREPLGVALAGINFATPRIPAFSNVTGEPHASAAEEIRVSLSQQVLQPVEFVRQIESMYARGARLFVEMGPRSTLSGLVTQILGTRSFTAFSLGAGSGALEDVLLALATLAAENVDLRLDALFDNRDVVEVDAIGTQVAPPAAASRWFVSGGSARPADEVGGKSGKLPFLEHGFVVEADSVDAAGAATQAAPPNALGARVPTPTVAANLPAANDVSAALIEYQGVMREFLQVQERIMTAFMSGDGASLAGEPLLAPQAAPLLPAVVASPSPSPMAIAAPQSAAPEVDRGTGRAAGVFDRPQLMDSLLTLAAERTGYPRDLLGMDQDVEAELGIDSIKRVEILGALQQQLPEAVRTHIPSMDVLTRLKTFGSIVDHLAAAVGERALASSSAAPAVQQQPDQQARPETAPAAVLDLLLTLVSERTGYPRDVLGLEQDVEAELGIDSIKRVEILGALAKQLPLDAAARLQGGMDRFTRIKTLAGMAAAIVDVAPDRAADPARPDLRPPPPAAVDAGARVPRFRIEARSEPLDAASADVPTGLWIVTEDSLGVADAISRALAAKGARGAVVSNVMLTDAGALDAGWRKLIADAGPVRGIVHVAGLMARHALDSDHQNLEASKRAGDVAVTGLFRLLKRCGVDWPQDAADVRVLAVTAFGGHFARDARGPVVGSAATGGMVGLLKTAAREWAGLRVKIVDVDPSRPADRIAADCVAELCSADRRVEIGYPSTGRTVFETVPADFSTTSSPGGGVAPAADWVVLITGGARGITAEAAHQFAECGAHLVIVGRSAPPSEPESADTAALDDEAALRRLFLARARALSAPVVPAAIDSQARALLRSRELRANLMRLEQRAASVEYVRLDVCDEPAVAALIDRVYRQYGRLDAVVHGAGVIDDRLIRDKDEASFARVFETKAVSSVVLARHLRPQGLRAVVFYSSIAGRFGNRGQADYAAANEAVNRLAWQLDRQWPDTRVVAINWGPWEGAGMATEAVASGFRARGILPIPRAAGRRSLFDELAHGRKGDVEIIVGAGPWSSLDGSDPPSTSSKSVRASNRLPLVPTAPQLDDRGAVTMEHVFSLSADPYLGDHRLDRAPVLPLAAVLEWVAEFVQAAWPDWTVAAVRDLRVLKGLVLEGRDSIPVRFRARASTHSDVDRLSVDVDVVDVERDLKCYSGTVQLDTLRRTADAPTDIAPLSGGGRLDAKSAYRDYLFHGDRFQLLTAIDVLTPLGVDAQAKGSRPAAFLDSGLPMGEWLFDPGLVDTAPQLAIVWSRVTHDTTAIPHRIGEARRFGPLTGPLRVALRVRPSSTEHAVVYDAVFVAPDGTVRLQLADVESACSTALNRPAAQVL